MRALSKKEEEAFSIREFMNNSALMENVENGARPHFLSFFLTLILDSRFNIYLDIFRGQEFF